MRRRRAQSPACGHGVARQGARVGDSDAARVGNEGGESSFEEKVEWDSRFSWEEREKKGTLPEESPRNLSQEWKNATESQSHGEKKEKSRVPLEVRSCRLCVRRSQQQPSHKLGAVALT